MLLIKGALCFLDVGGNWGTRKEASQNPQGPLPTTIHGEWPSCGLLQTIQTVYVVALTIKQSGDTLVHSRKSKKVKMFACMHAMQQNGQCINCASYCWSLWLCVYAYIILVESIAGCLAVWSKRYHLSPYSRFGIDWHRPTVSCIPPDRIHYEGAKICSSINKINEGKITQNAMTSDAIIIMNASTGEEITSIPAQWNKKNTGFRVCFEWTWVCILASIDNGIKF